MPTNETMDTAIPNARARLAWFARGATIGGWVLLAVPLIFSPILVTKAGRAVCGTGLVLGSIAAFILNTSCQALGVALSATALVLPKAGPDGTPKLWLIVAAASLAACLSIIVLVRSAL